LGNPYKAPYKNVFNYLLKLLNTVDLQAAILLAALARPAQQRPAKEKSDASVGPYCLVDHR
jgi:hypothetical protein